MSARKSGAAMWAGLSPPPQELRTLAQRALSAVMSGACAAVEGNAPKANGLLQQLLHFDPPGPDIARIYVGLGDIEQALQWLEKAAAQRNLTC
jgi:hypothetical protein